MKRLLLVLLSIPLIAPVPSAAQTPTLVVHNARILVGDGSMIERGSIAIAGERIVAVQPGDVDADGVRRLDAEGSTALPGLIDTHVHLTLEDISGQPRSEAELRAFLRHDFLLRLRIFNGAGITTVMSTGDYWPYAGNLPETIGLDRLGGPRRRTAGRVITAAGGHPAATVCGFLDPAGPNPWCREHLVLPVETADEVRKGVALLRRGGVDLVKFVYETGNPVVAGLDSALVGEIVRAAHESGLPAYAHIPEVQLAIEAIEKGLDGLVHLPGLSEDEALRERMAELMHAEGVIASSTLVSIEDTIQSMRAAGDEETARTFEDLMAGTLASLATLVAVNPGLIAIGTDVPHIWRGGAYYREIELLSEAGLTNEQILAAATRNAARYMGLGEELGTLDVGKLADLILVDGDPLADLAVLRNSHIVIRGGQVVKQGGGRR